MLKILNNGKYLPVARKDNFNIVTNYEGEQTLSFDVYVKDEIYNLIVEEADIVLETIHTKKRKLIKDLNWPQ